MQRFGVTKAGADVHRLVLEADDLRVAVLTLGIILQDVRLAGVDRPLTAGSPDLAPYDDGPMSFFGSTVGPLANRIGGARCTLDGQPLRFDANSAGGHHLHSGTSGLHAKVWSVTGQGPSHAVLEISAADGEGGLPGNRHWRAEWRVEAGALSLTLDATTDAPTLMNCANHSYWTLGAGADGTRLQVAADRYLPTDGNALTLGESAPVAGTRFDFRKPRALQPADRIDACFCLSDARTDLRPVARLETDDLWLEMATTEPGLQVYTADPFEGATGHATYGPRFGVALEAQFWPDAPNHPSYPSIRLAPGVAWRQEVRWRIGRT